MNLILIRPILSPNMSKLNLYKFYSNQVINHFMSILISIFIYGYHGKTTDFAKNSSYHRTTIAHFLNSRKWDDSLLADSLKASVIEIIYSEALWAFLSTDVSLTTNEILSYYVCRWPIEVFFRQCKDKLALDRYQIRSLKGIQRY